MSIAEQILKRLDGLPEDAQREVLDFTEFLKDRQQRFAATEYDFHKYRDNDEHRAIGQAGLKLAAETLPAEDFSDWPGFIPDKGTEHG
jgi:hypothetical protein